MSQSFKSDWPTRLWLREAKWASWKLRSVEGKVHMRAGDCNNKTEDAEAQTTTRAAGAHGCSCDGRQAGGR
jgi:hypothetical protein